MTEPHRAARAGKIPSVISGEEILERLRALPAVRTLSEHVRGILDVHVVGGAVRDLLLGGAPYDLDLVVEGDALAFARSLGGSLRVHDRFGTSTVTLDGFSYDIARSRRETYAHPGALPEVVPASLQEDLLRRDFTVNAIALALADGSLTQAPHALEDLRGRRLRVLHEASFVDDPTRMLRLVRYASRLRFAIDPHTRALIDGRALSTVSGARVGNELRLLARERDPVAALECLHALGLDRAIHPTFGIADGRLARRALGLAPEDGRRDRLTLAVAALEVPGEELASLLDSLSFPAADRDAILAAATKARALAAALEPVASPSQTAETIGGAGPELVALAGALGAAGPAEEWFGRLRHVQLEIGGDDLLANGVPPGPSVGRALRAALAAKLDGRAAGREEELRVALEAAGLA